MRLSDFESPPMTREEQNVGITVIPKMNCEHHLIHIQIGQSTTILTLTNAGLLAKSLQATIDEIDDEVGKTVFA